MRGFVEFGIGFAHFGDERVDELVEERSAGAELVAVANGAAADAAQHVGAAFVARNDAVGHREGAGADVVGDHLEGRRAVFDRDFRDALHRGLGGGEKVLKEVDVVVRVNALQNRGDAFEPHARVDRGFGSLCITPFSSR